MCAANLLPRYLLATFLIVMSHGSAAAQPTAEPAGDTLLLWPDGTPGSGQVTVREIYVERAPHGPVRDRYVEHVTRPALTFFRPRNGGNGRRLLIVPGGGYVRVVIDKEGFESAQWFAERGFECAVLRYRLPADGWPAGADAPLHDIRRAIRLLRAPRGTAAAPGDVQVGIIGFSAGGHAVARFITGSGTDYTHVDASDEVEARVDFAVLMYPVIATSGPSAHSGSATQLRQAGVAGTALDDFSPQLHVDPNTAPTLLVHAADDEAVPVENSLMMFAALRRAGVSAELHVFDRGGHGFGLRGVSGQPVAAWPQLVENWARAHGPLAP